MLPDQPFYLSVNELPLNAVVPAPHTHLDPGVGKFSTTTASYSKSRMVLVHFDLKSPVSVLSGHTATVSVNGRAYHGLPFTMINITKLLSITGENQLVISGRHIPTDVTVHADVVKKVTEEELLHSISKSSLCVHKRRETLALVRAQLEEAGPGAGHYLEVPLSCPLTERRIRIPGRGVHCRHAQCFDVFAYLGLNENTLQPPWSCPVCGEEVLVQDIRVDLLMLDFLIRGNEAVSMILPGPRRPGCG